MPGDGSMPYPVVDYFFEMCVAVALEYGRLRCWIGVSCAWMPGTEAAWACPRRARWAGSVLT